jgi:hypothetical protein
MGGVAHAIRGVLGDTDVTKNDRQLEAVRRALEDGDIEKARRLLASDSESESELSKIENAILNMSSLLKAENANPTVMGRVLKAQRECSEEYLRKSTGAWSDPDVSAHLQAVRERESALRAA